MDFSKGQTKQMNFEKHKSSANCVTYRDVNRPLTCCKPLHISSVEKFNTLAKEGERRTST